MHPPQGITGLRAKPETISKEEADQVLLRNIEETKAKLCRKAYILQSALCSFKVKSRVLQENIQHEMDQVNLDTDIEANKLTEGKNSLLSYLVALNKELTAAKSIITESYKNSKYSIKEIKALEVFVLYKRLNINWASSILKGHLMWRKKITHALTMLNTNTESFFGVSPVSYENGNTVGSKSTAASLISELNSMIIEFSTLEMKSKFRNIDLQTSNQKISDPPNEPMATPFGIKPTTTDDNLDPSSGIIITDVPERRAIRTAINETRENLPNTPFICTPAVNERWIESIGGIITTDARRSSIPRVERKAINATHELPNTPLIFSPSVNEQWLDRLGTGLVSFNPLVGTDVSIKSGVSQTITVNHQCITLMKQYECKSLEELRLIDYVRAACRGRKYSAVFALPQDQLNKIAFFYTSRKASEKISMGTQFVKFKPTVDYEKIDEEYICITLMPVFNHKSLEELRLEDYFVIHNNSNTSCSWFKATDLNSKWQRMAEVGRFKPHVESDRIIIPRRPCQELTLEYQCFTELYENKSFEEISLEDYTSGRSKSVAYVSPFPPHQVFGAKKAIGPFKPTQDTGYVRFTPRVGKEDDSDLKVKYQCITFMTEYENKSVEELRLIDYAKAASEGRKFVPVFALPQNQLLKIAFFYTTSLTVELRSRPAQAMFIPPTGTDVIIRRGTSVNINTMFQCITFMPEYQNKSLEEIRLEDYVVYFSAKRLMKTRPVLRKRREKPPIGRMPEYSLFTQEQAQKPPTPKNQTPECNFTPKTRETPTQKNQTPQCNSTSKTRETPTQENQTSECNCTPKTRETPTQENQTSECNCTPKTRETPTQDNQTSECNSTPKTRETPTQKNQTPECDSTSKTRETPTQKNLTPECNSTSKARETPINVNYEKAVEIANEALKLDPENPLYLTDRGDAYYMLRDYKQALEDAKKATAIDSTVITGYILTAKCCVKLGDIAFGEQVVKRGTDMLVKLRRSEPYNESVYANEHKTLLELGTRLKELRSHQEKARKLLDQEKYYDALDLINTCLDNYCPSCYKTKLLKAECLANIGKYQEAQDIAINLAIFERYDADAIYVVGLCLYNQGKDEQALENFRKVNNLDPDNKKAARMYKKTKARNTSKLLQQKKAEGNQAFENGDYEDALRLYTEALLIDKDNKEMNATLHYNKATVYAKLNRTREAEQACTLALSLKPDHMKALKRRALCCTELGEREDALDDYSALLQLYKQHNLADSAIQEVKRLLDKAEEALKKFKRTNYYYKILEIENCATAKPSDIRKSYLQHSRLFHPDKVSVQEKCVAERGARRFRRIKEAYDVLYDATKRKNYDRMQNNNDDDDDNNDDDDDDNNNDDDDDDENNYNGWNNYDDSD